MVAGGFEAGGASSARVDVYDPAARTWQRGPDLPAPVNHAAAVTLSGRVVVVGGYANGGRAAVALAGDAWERLTC